MPDRTKELNQYFTPVWAAEALYGTFFDDVSEGDYIIEPTCGDGRFLQVIPHNVRAVGVELDPVMAERARERTGRQVITGDFTKVDIEGGANHIVGNPPYDLKILDAILDRAKSLLRKDGSCGFVLPSYAFQTPSRVMRYSIDWCLEPHFIPRTLFPGLSKPLMFAMFRKEGRQWIGMKLYAETHEVAQMKPEYSETLTSGHGSVWRTVVGAAISSLGGEASLKDIYEEVSKKRPTETTWWREKIRQIARRHFENTGPGRYALPESLAA